MATFTPPPGYVPYRYPNIVEGGGRENGMIDNGQGEIYAYFSAPDASGMAHGYDVNGQDMGMVNIDNGSIMGNFGDFFTKFVVPAATLYLGSGLIGGAMGGGGAGAAAGALDASGAAVGGGYSAASGMAGGAELLGGAGTGIVNGLTGGADMAFGTAGADLGTLSGAAGAGTMTAAGNATLTGATGAAGSGLLSSLPNASGVLGGLTAAGLPSLLQGAGSLVSGLAGLANIGNVGGEAGASAADPFAPYRAQYAALLSKLMGDPVNELPKTPGYMAGLDAVQRAGAAQGWTGGGNMAVALQKYGGDIYNQQVSQLSRLAGADIGSPATAGQLLSQGDVNQANLLGQSLNSLAYGAQLAGWTNPTQPSSPNITPGNYPGQTWITMGGP